MIILYVLREKIPTEMAINEYSALPLDEDIDVDVDVEELKGNEYELKIWKSAEAFKNKKKILIEEMENKLQEMIADEDIKSKYTKDLENFPRKPHPE